MVLARSFTILHDDACKIMIVMEDADEGEDDINDEEEEDVDDIVDHVVFAKYFSQEFCEEQHEEGANIDIIDDLTTSCKISYAPIIDKGVDDIDPR